MKTDLSNALRAVTGAMESPVVVILLILMAAALVLIATLIAEIFTERIRMKAKMPKLVDDLKAGKRSLNAIIYDSGLLKRQKKVLYELNAHPDITPAMRESLAVRLLEEEKGHYDFIIMISDMVARIAPMCGLLGTLIPLGPGIIALGQGDTYTLSNSLLTAFDTTAAGLLAAAAAFIVSAIRKRWYTNYMSALEMAMECLLEVINNGDDLAQAKEDDYEDTYDQNAGRYDENQYAEGYTGGYDENQYADGYISNYDENQYSEGYTGRYSEGQYSDDYAGGYDENQYGEGYASRYGENKFTEGFVWPEHHEADSQAYEWSAENNSNTTVEEIEAMQAQQTAAQQNSEAAWTVVETEAPSYQSTDAEKNQPTQNLQKNLQQELQQDTQQSVQQDEPQGSQQSLQKDAQQKSSTTPWWE